ncbi:DUF962 domain-containing protein [Burkholderiaceae bacterium DAT-1]|nr:DUF962 domain-containing protein [Burkholderiaceae bacterium DAT-1]
MKTLDAHLANYAAYHRDTRNIATHFVGIPMIVVSVAILLSKLTVLIVGWRFSAAAVVAAGASLFYLNLNRPIGILMSILMALSVWAGYAAAAQDTQTWLMLGVGGFVVGWIIQFVGHVFEGRKPAFVDDLTGLIIGPLFVACEALFMLGMCLELKAQIEAVVGPTRSGKISKPA